MCGYANVSDFGVIRGEPAPPEWVMVLEEIPK